MNSEAEAVAVIFGLLWVVTLAGFVHLKMMAADLTRTSIYLKAQVDDIIQLLDLVNEESFRDPERKE